MTKCWKEQKWEIVFALKREKEKKEGRGTEMRDRGRKEKERKGNRKMIGQYIIKGT